MSKKNVLSQLATQFSESYTKETSVRLRIIDQFIAYCVAMSVIQVGYAVLVGHFPMNSLLSGVAVSLGSAVITGTEYSCSI